MFRRLHRLEVLIGHMGGPYWARKQRSAYSIPKGAVEPGEQPLDAALREFQEETGLDAPAGPYVPLGDVRQRSGKVVSAWAVEADPDLDAFVPAMVAVTIRGSVLQVAELDRLVWAAPAEARPLLISAQAGFLDRLITLTGEPGS